jgi:hypothetical protein
MFEFDEPSEEFKDEVKKRIKQIQNSWSEKTRVRRQFASVSRRSNNGLSVPAYSECIRLNLQPYKAKRYRKHIEDDETRCDCPYWMHEGFS